MTADDIDNHPDLRDEAWIRAANRRAKRDIRRARRRARLRAHGGKAVSAVALVAIAALLFGLYRAGEFDGVGQAVADSVETAAAPVDLDEPFANTPAEAWADGEAGVVAPAAQPVGEFSAEQVAQAYERVRQAVITARLDLRVVRDHDVEPYLALLAPDLQDHMRPLFDGGNDPEASLVVTRVAKGSELLPVAPKVNGSMRAEAGEPGELVVHTDYLVAYAFTGSPALLTSPYDIVAVSRVSVDYVLRSGEGFREGSQGLWAEETDGHWYSISCEAAERGFLAPWVADRAMSGGTPGEFGPSEDYFDPNRPMPTTDGCTR
ncbi:hypothetical protein [Saccharothrix coeruleofusca]|uniref:Uncharacterized protein n=1 Tax=Saccharothrix coeruleofusca TaxID=33919 RepID=A0A918AIU7_9PSEU|nr:hypothetical protein [Saccharothrix coeruleofusca]GGP42886.1 hypothetical protein GCM10010185_13010 [Saccharothrix coeruleofusca]